MSFTPDPFPSGVPTQRPRLATHHPQGEAQPTMLDMANQLIRMETRLVKLMYHVGLDANGRVREES